MISWIAKSSGTEAVAGLKEALNGCTNAEVILADLSKPGVSSQVGRDNDLAYALDVLEYVPTPEAFLRNVSESLSDEGEAFITFPNVPPPVPESRPVWTGLGGGEGSLIQAFGLGGSGISTGPPAVFQAPKPPRIWATGFNPMRCAAWAASAERRPPAQKNTKRLSCANCGL